MDDVLTSFNQTCSPNMLAQTMLGKPTAAGDAALEDKFWREVPQQLWDKLVLKDGIPGEDDGRVANKLLEEVLHDPRLHKYVDVTSDGLRRFFEAVDTNSDGVISVDELQEGFQRTLNDFHLWEDTPEFHAYWEETWASLLKVLRELIQAPADSEMDPFCYEIFCGLLRRLKLELTLRIVNDQGGARLLPLPMMKSIIKIDISGRRTSIQLEEEEVVLKTYTWNPRNVHGMDITRKHMRAFFLCHREPQWAVRWVIADSCDRANIIRLSIKYRFHPLHLEDVLKLERQQPRFLKYGGHYFIILPLLRLIQNPEEDGNKSTSNDDGTGAGNTKDRRSHHHAGIHMEKSRMAIFAAGPPHFDTIISIHGAWRTVRNRCCHRKKSDPETAATKGTSEFLGYGEGTHDTFLTPSVMPQAHRVPSMSSRQDSEDIIMTNNEDGFAFDAPSSVLTATANLLHEEYSSVRQGNSNWMLHAMIDMTARMLAPIVAAYDRRLRLFQKELEGPDSMRMRDRLSKPIMDMKHDLIWLQKRVKSIKPVIRSLISEPKLMGDEVVFYIQGVDDELEVLFDDINTMLTLTQGLLDEAKYIKDETRNESLKLFAVMTTTFCPLQFLAGYFGMNFQDHNGVSTIPLMRDPNGPLWFWLGCLLCASSFLAYIRFKRRWI